MFTPFYLFYIHAKAIIKTISLTGVVSGSVTGLERVQLALSLARALLRSHAPPWLPEFERSENVRFYSVDSSNAQRPGLFKAPFLNLKCLGPYDAAQTDSTKDPLSEIRNNILFRLRIVLLELGFESPS